MNMVALIPARAGSKRLPGKNTKLLWGHPVIAYTIAAAQQSGVFSSVWICTDDPAVRALCVVGSGLNSIERLPVSDTQPDIEWVRDALRFIERPHGFAILRPTSPFRTAETIRRCYQQFTIPDQTCDSIRAVEPVTQTPYKMWTWEGQGFPIKPLLSGEKDGVPYHSSPTQACPVVYIQNSSLEMAWTANVEIHGSISGRKVAPFFTHGLEGFSLDTPADWERAQALVAADPGCLPPLGVAALSAVSGSE